MWRNREKTRLPISEIVNAQSLNKVSVHLKKVTLEILFDFYTQIFSLRPLVQRLAMACTKDSTGFRPSFKTPAR